MITLILRNEDSDAEELTRASVILHENKEGPPDERRQAVGDIVTTICAFAWEAIHGVFPDTLMGRMYRVTGMYTTATEDAFRAELRAKIAALVHTHGKTYAEDDNIPLGTLVLILPDFTAQQMLDSLAIYTETWVEVPNQRMAVRIGWF